jgi:DNA-binding beta-propeller fold protein YncE
VKIYPLVCVLAGCTASGASTEPPQDQLFYPTSATLSPDESVLFVTSANSDLRYSSGAIDVLDLEQVDATIAAWTSARTIPAGCNADTDHRETLVCDEAAFMRPNAGARIGNFATTIAMQDRGGGRSRLIIPVRGDPSVTWVDWDGTTLTCNTDGQPFSLCDDDHRLLYVHNDSNVGLLSTEPFDAAADSAQDFAIITHLTSGAVTLIDSPRDGMATIADVSTGLFLPNDTGLIGTSGVAVRGNDMVYVGSPFENRIQTFTVGRPINNAPAYLLAGDYFFLDVVGGNAGGSSDTRALQFVGDKMYAMNRNPPSVMTFDTSVGDTGTPGVTLESAVDVCREGERITVGGDGDGDRIYVTCFQDGQLYVVDPRGEGSAPDIITTGRGPYAAAASATRHRVYVTNFLEDTISVIDTAAGSPTQGRVVLKIGEPKAP